MPTEMLTYHHSFSTRIFPYGESRAIAHDSAGKGLGANRDVTAADQLAWRRDHQSRGLSAVPPPSRGNEGSGFIGKSAPHAH